MKTILLIEDNIDIQETTSAILHLARYNVLVASDGKEGVEVALREKPDLIICDIMMPVLDGFGVLHLLSKNDDAALIPFIFLTAKTERSDVRRGMDLGADDYITKPFSETELLNAIEGRLKKAELMKKEYANSASGLDEFLTEIKDFGDLQQISENRDSRIHQKKDVIYREGSFPKSVFFLSKGNVKTYKTNEQGKEFITGMYKEGDFFGYLPVLEETAYDDSAMAMDEVEINTIPKDDFFSLVYKNHQISRRFLRMVSNNLKDREQQLIRLAYNSVRKRVAEALIKIHLHFAGGEESLIPMRSLEIPREDLANLAGTATETTIRTLSDFKQEGLIEIKGSQITILQYEELVEMKN